jgi:hypothetical protein
MVPNAPLRKCPTCLRELDDEVRKQMGLRTGELLNSLCPGKNGPSDIDHVLHNMHVNPHRIAFIEYKGRKGTPLPDGQRYLHRDLNGIFTDTSTGKKLEVMTWVLWQHDPDPLEKISQVTDWTFGTSSRLQFFRHFPFRPSRKEKGVT